MLCVHTHFKQLSLDPELSPDPKANMTFDNLPLRSPHYFRTIMYLEVSACPRVCSYSDTLLSALSSESLFSVSYPFQEVMWILYAVLRQGAINLFILRLRAQKEMRHMSTCVHLFCLFFGTDLVLCLM